METGPVFVKTSEVGLPPTKEGVIFKAAGLAPKISSAISYRRMTQSSTRMARVFSSATRHECFTVDFVPEGLDRGDRSYSISMRRTSAMPDA